jgi:hypothetical protein
MEATRQVMLVHTNLMPETYDVCRVHTGKRYEAVDYVTLAHHWQIPLHRAKHMVERTDSEACALSLLYMPNLQYPKQVHV